MKYSKVVSRNASHLETNMSPLETTVGLFSNPPKILVSTCYSNVFDVYMVTKSVIMWPRALLRVSQFLGDCIVLQNKAGFALV